jgi:hypothetical protein
MQPWMIALPVLVALVGIAAALTLGLLLLSKTKEAAQLTEQIQKMQSEGIVTSSLRKLPLGVKMNIICIYLATDWTEKCTELYQSMVLYLVDEERRVWWVQIVRHEILSKDGLAQNNWIMVVEENGQRKIKRL